MSTETVSTEAVRDTAGNRRTVKNRLPALEELRPGHVLMLGSGAQIDPFGEIDPADIHLEDIALGLANATRWLGQTVRRFSVAEHAMIGARFVPPALKLEFLLHDAPEAYLPEMPRSLKMRPEFDFYRAAEQRLWVAIATRFGLPQEFSQSTHDTDTRMAEAEYRALVQGVYDPWEGRSMERHIVEPLRSDTFLPLHERFKYELCLAFYDQTFGA